MADSLSLVPLDPPADLVRKNTVETFLFYFTGSLRAVLCAQLLKGLFMLLFLSCETRIITSEFEFSASGLLLSVCTVTEGSARSAEALAEQLRQTYR